MFKKQRQFRSLELAAEQPPPAGITHMPPEVLNHICEHLGANTLYMIGACLRGKPDIFIFAINIGGELRIKATHDSKKWIAEQCQKTNDEPPANFILMKQPNIRCSVTNPVFRTGLSKVFERLRILLDYGPTTEKDVTSFICFPGDESPFLIWITRDFISFGARFGARFGENGRMLRYTRRITDSSTTSGEQRRDRISGVRKLLCGKRRVCREAETHEALVQRHSPWDTGYESLGETAGQEDAEMIDTLLVGRQYLGVMAFTRGDQAQPFFTIKLGFCRTGVNDAREGM